MLAASTADAPPPDGAVVERLAQVLERARSARGDHGDLHRATHCAGELEVVAVARAVAVHAGEQDLARAEPLDARHPFDARRARSGGGRRG